VRAVARVPPARIVTGGPERCAELTRDRRPRCDNRVSMWWGKVVQEVRKAGPRKIVILVIVAAIAVALAYGDNSSNDAASGRTLPRAVLVSAQQLHQGARP
jgi:hypothetical protein